jgi:hypothetical protein
MAALFQGVCPSGQRERSVKPSAQPTEVRILPPPLLSIEAESRMVIGIRPAWHARWRGEGTSYALLRSALGLDGEFRQNVC